MSGEKKLETEPGQEVDMCRSLLGRDVHRSPGRQKWKKGIVVESQGFGYT